jgi:hypothetical protein
MLKQYVHNKKKYNTGHLHDILVHSIGFIFIPNRHQV